MATHAERRAGTQAAVMKAARKLFGERGFAATSVDDIAAASRVAKGAIYHYFRTKNDLFEAVFEAGLGRPDRRTSTARCGARRTRSRRSPPARSSIFPNAPGGRRARSSCATARRCSAGSAGARSTKSILAARYRARSISPWTPVSSRASRSSRLARLLLGAISEAAAACAGRSDIETVGADYARAFRSCSMPCGGAELSSAKRNKRMQKCRLACLAAAGQGSRLAANRVMEGPKTASRDGRK